MHTADDRTTQQTTRAQNCQWAPFGPWTSCSKPCGAGLQRRQRTVALKAEPGGTPCRINGASETRLCNRQPCGSGQISTHFPPSLHSS